MGKYMIFFIEINFCLFSIYFIKIWPDCMQGCKLFPNPCFISLLIKVLLKI